MSRLPRRCVAGLAALVVLGGCAAESAPSEPPLLSVVENGPVVPVVAASTALPGSVLQVTFTNTVDREFWFNPCERVVQRREGEGWVLLPEELRMCNSMAYILRPNAERHEGVDVPADLGPGEYRFVFTMRAPATPDVAHRPASTAFVVR